MKRTLIAGLLAILAMTAAQAQNDLVLLVNPNQNEQKLMLRSNTTFVGEEDDRSTGDDFKQIEQTLALRYAIIQDANRELYLTVNSQVIDLDTTAVFKETAARVPDELYNLGAGVLYRQTVHTDWRVGGKLNVGSASDKLFDSTDEIYVKGLAFLQIPHLEYTSWIAILGFNTDWQIPVVPGIAYSFPLSERALAVVGFPFMGAAGQITDRLGFQAFYAPFRNADATLNYQATERITPYAGFRWRGRIFSRADRSDDDDRLVFEDKRLLLGTGFGLTDRATLDVQTGYLFDRMIGEGDSIGDQNDNNVRIDNAWYSSLQFTYQF